MTRLARLRARQATIAQQRAHAEAEREKVAGERAALDERARGARGPPAGRSPSGGLAEMRAWLQKHAQIVDAFAAVRDLETDAAETRAEARGRARASSRRRSVTRPTAAGARSSCSIARRRKLDAHRARLAAQPRRRARTIAKLEAEIDERKAALLRDEALLAEARAGSPSSSRRSAFPTTPPPTR